MLRKIEWQPEEHRVMHKFKTAERKAVADNLWQSQGLEQGNARVDYL